MGSTILKCGKGDIMENAVVMHQTGGPEVLPWETYDPGPPAGVDRQTYLLSEAARVHQDLEDRKTVGSSVLVPS
jgi:hypothetical protein